AHRRAHQICVDLLHVAWIFPLLRQIRPVAIVPGKVISGEIDENEYRSVFVLFGNHSHRCIEEETVRFELARTEIVLLVETLHAGGGLEAARAHERAQSRIERNGAIAAAL